MFAYPPAPPNGAIEGPTTGPAVLAAATKGFRKNTKAGVPSTKPLAHAFGDARAGIQYVNGGCGRGIDPPAPSFTNAGWAMLVNPLFHDRIQAGEILSQKLRSVLFD